MNIQMNNRKMTVLVDSIKALFDTLYTRTPNGMDQHGVYADTRTEDGHYSVTSTQSGVSAYGAYEADHNKVLPGTVRPREMDAFTCVDPSTCPDCDPLADD